MSDDTRERIMKAAMMIAKSGGRPNWVEWHIPEESMQAILDAGELAGTPSEVRSIVLAYAMGMERVLQITAPDLKVVVDGEAVVTKVTT